jgi:hypothetical protein
MESETRDWIEARRALSWRVQSRWQLASMVALLAGIGCLTTGMWGGHTDARWYFAAAAAFALGTALNFVGVRRHRQALEAQGSAR